MLKSLEQIFWYRSGKSKNHSSTWWRHFLFRCVDLRVNITKKKQSWTSACLKNLKRNIEVLRHNSQVQIAMESEMRLKLLSWVLTNVESGDAQWDQKTFLWQSISIEMPIFLKLCAEQETPANVLDYLDREARRMGKDLWPHLFNWYGTITYFCIHRKLSDFGNQFFSQKKK